VPKIFAIRKIDNCAIRHLSSSLGLRLQMVANETGVINDKTIGISRREKYSGLKQGGNAGPIAPTVLYFNPNNISKSKAHLIPSISHLCKPLAASHHRRLQSPDLKNVQSPHHAKPLWSPSEKSSRLIQLPFRPTATTSQLAARQTIITPGSSSQAPHPWNSSRAICLHH
jgi:hypothetical protein